MSKHQQQRPTEAQSIRAQCDRVLRNYEKPETQELYKELVKLTIEKCERLLLDIHDDGLNDGEIEKLKDEYSHDHIKGIVTGRIKKFKSLRTKLRGLERDPQPDTREYEWLQKELRDPAAPARDPLATEIFKRRLEDLQKKFDDPNHAPNFREWARNEANRIYRHPELGDLAGIRVGLYLPDDIITVINRIKEHFNVKWTFGTVNGGRHTTLDKNVDRAKHLDGLWLEPTSDGSYRSWEFHGYRSWQVVVEWKPFPVPTSLDEASYVLSTLAGRMTSLTQRMANASLDTVRVEIQVGTVVTQAWAEVQHNLIYKNPRHLESTPSMLRMIDATNGLAISNDIMLQELKRNIDLAIVKQEKEKEEHFLDVPQPVAVERLGATIRQHLESRDLDYQVGSNWLEILSIITRHGLHASSRADLLTRDVMETQTAVTKFMSDHGILSNDAKGIFANDVPLSLLEILSRQCWNEWCNLTEYEIYVLFQRSPAGPKPRPVESEYGIWLTLHRCLLVSNAYSLLATLGGLPAIDEFHREYPQFSAFIRDVNCLILGELADPDEKTKQEIEGLSLAFMDLTYNECTEMPLLAIAIVLSKLWLVPGIDSFRRGVRTIEATESRSEHFKSRHRENPDFVFLGHNFCRPHQEYTLWLPMSAQTGNDMKTAGNAVAPNITKRMPSRGTSWTVEHTENFMWPPHSHTPGSQREFEELRVFGVFATWHSLSIIMVHVKAIWDGKIPERGR